MKKRFPTVAVAGLVMMALAGCLPEKEQEPFPNPAEVAPATSAAEPETAPVAMTPTPTPVPTATPKPVEATPTPAQTKKAKFKTPEEFADFVCDFGTPCSPEDKKKHKKKILDYVERYEFRVLEHPEEERNGRRVRQAQSISEEIREHMSDYKPGLWEEIKSRLE